MKWTIAILLGSIVLATAQGPAWADQPGDDEFLSLMTKRQLPAPKTLEEFADQVARMGRLGASSATISQRMSEVIDRRLEASNKPQGESLFNPFSNAKEDRDRRWAAVDAVMKGDDGLPGKPLEDGRLGQRLAEAAWDNRVGNCCESANVALEVLRRAGIPARLFNAATGGAHEFVVIGLKPNADPNDPTTWGEDARVVDGWIGNALTPTEAFENKHIFNKRTTSPDGKEIVSDQTGAYYDPRAEANLKALGNKGKLRVELVDEKKKPVAGATIKLKTQEPQEVVATAQGIATFTTYPGKIEIDVTPPKGSPLRPAHGEVSVETRRLITVLFTLTLGESTSKWNGRWRGKVRSTVTNDRETQSHQSVVEVEIVQQGDLIIMRMPGQKEGATEHTLDPKDSNVARGRDTKQMVDLPIVNSTVKRDVVLTLNGDRIHSESISESTTRTRVNQQAPWTENHAKMQATTDFERVR